MENANGTAAQSRPKAKTQAQLKRLKANLDRQAKREVQEAWTQGKSKDGSIEGFFYEVSMIKSCYADDIERLEADGWVRPKPA